MSLDSMKSSHVTPAFRRVGLIQWLRTWQAQARDYAAMFSWLMRDVFAHFRWRSLRILISGALHLAGKFSAMGVVYFFIELIEQKREANILGFALPSPDSPALLAFGVAAMLVCLFAAAIFRFDVRRQSLAVGRQYEEYCDRRTFVLSSRLPHGDADWATREVTSGRINAHIGYARLCGRVAGELGEFIPAVAGFALASVILMVIEPGLSLIIAALALLALAAQYPVNRKAAEISRVLEENQRESNRRLKGVLRSVRSAPVPLEMDSPVLDRTFADESVRAMLDGIARRRRMTAESGLVSQLASGLILAAILLIMGVGLLEGTRSWGEAIVYLAALRFALRDFVKASGVFVAVNRFYTQISRHFEFVRSASKALAAPAEIDDAPFERIRFDLPALDGAAEPLVLEPGDSLALITPRKTYLGIPGLLHEVQQGSADAAHQLPFRIDSMLIDPTVPLRTSLVLPDRLDAEALASELAAFAPEGDGLGWATPDWLDRTPRVSWEFELPLWAIFALQALVALQRGRCLLLIKASVFEELHARWREALTARLAGGVLLLIHRRVRTIGDYGERAAVLFDRDEALSWVAIDGSAEKRTLLADAFDAIAAKDSPAPGETGDPAGDEEDEEDDDDALI